MATPSKCSLPSCQARRAIDSICGTEFQHCARHTCAYMTSLEGNINVRYCSMFVPEMGLVCPYHTETDGILSYDVQLLLLNNCGTNQNDEKVLCIFDADLHDGCQHGKVFTKNTDDENFIIFTATHWTLNQREQKISFDDHYDEYKIHKQPEQRDVNDAAIESIMNLFG